MQGPAGKRLMRGQNLKIHGKSRLNTPYPTLPSCHAGAPSPCRNRALPVDSRRYSSDFDCRIPDSNGYLVPLGEGVLIAACGCPCKFCRFAGRTWLLVFWQLTRTALPLQTCIHLPGPKFEDKGLAFSPDGTVMALLEVRVHGAHPL